MQRRTGGPSPWSVLLKEKIDQRHCFLYGPYQMKDGMQFVTEPERQTPVVEESDVLVVGGGPAGMIAAIAAAREGAKTSLIERYGFLGGMATAALVGPFASVRHRYGGGRIVGGIPWEMIQRMVEHRGALLETFDYTSVRGEKTEPEGDSTTLFAAESSQPSRGDVPFDPEILKWVAEQMASEAGVRLRYHTFAAGVVKEENRIEAITVESKSGREAIRGKVIVDATGDADIAFFAGVPFEVGRTDDGALQPMSLIFRLSGVDTDALGDISRPYIHGPIRKKAGELVESKQLPMFGGPWTFWGSTFRRGEVMVNMVRLWGNGTDVHVLTKNEITARDHVQQFVRFLKKHFEEFRDCYLMDSGPQIGVRETRRITGDYCLTEEDVRTSREFRDSIALAGHVIDIHSPNGTAGQVRRKVAPYQIPYRCLLPRGVVNLLVAGRPISSTHEAHASLRVMGTAMATGQAAGIAAALAAQGIGDPRAVDVEQLQRTLRELAAPYKPGWIV